MSHSYDNGTAGLRFVPAGRGPEQPRQQPQTLSNQRPGRDSQDSRAQNTAAWGSQLATESAASRELHPLSRLRWSGLRLWGCAPGLVEPGTRESQAPEAPRRGRGASGVPAVHCFAVLAGGKSAVTAPA